MLHQRKIGPFITPLKLTLSLAAVAAFVCLSLCGALVAVAQTHKGMEDGPLMRDFKGVSLGMTADEVRQKLGSPKEKADDQDFYVLNDKLTAQVLYDKSHKVVTISADFMGGADAPTPKALFGSDIEAKPDGSMYKLVRYPKVGCWVSYSRTTGDNPLVTVTIQKN